MKVTTLIPDPLVREVRELAKGKTLTDSLLLALREWTSTKKSLLVAEKIRQKPLSFTPEAISGRLRQINRSR